MPPSSKPKPKPKPEPTPEPEEKRPVAKNLRDEYEDLIELEDYVNKFYNYHPVWGVQNWIDVFFQNKDEILERPKFAKLKDILDKMPNGPEDNEERIRRNYMKYAWGRFEKENPPEKRPPRVYPRYDALDRYYLTASKGVVGVKKSPEERLELAKAKREELKRHQISVEKYLVDLANDERERAAAVELRARAHDQRKAEANGSATAPRHHTEKYSYDPFKGKPRAPPQPNRFLPGGTFDKYGFDPKAQRAVPINLGTFHPTTGGGHR
jgi:hypothetical protein